MAEEEEEEEDIISTLPDAILCHILSFLETKHAVATSVLSKRWKHLCHSVPVLCFDTTITNQIEYISFINFVYSILLSRDPAFPINTFHFYFTYYEHEIHYAIDTITKWVKFLAQRGLQYLDLQVNRSSLYFTELPITIINYKTLVVLKLHSFSMEETSSLVYFPSLKTLDLDAIVFPKHRDFMLFLNGCPILENLHVFHVWFDSEEPLTCDEWKDFWLTNLTRAELNCFCHHVLWKAIHNVAYLHLKIDDQVYYRDEFIHTFHNLTQLDLYYPNYSCHFILQVLKHCPKLQKFKIDQDGFIEEISNRKDDRENWVDPDVVPQCLLLHLRTCDLIHFLGLQGELLLARYILKNARVLQTMRINNVGKTNIKRLISSCPRASTTCEVAIYPRFKKKGRK